ncbi:GDSL-like Lipase/Acylhydrolase [Symmachiella dynata]|uniref:GDSL-like Lipase/Acylhydrolase n=2 Tax=Symmachiella dynata TaxID=2527995 RepID=A0A517ZKN1_9PLAN|nr:GDSL-like Lipase/Acylhydrolase [Symmachiella dynata]
MFPRRIVALGSSSIHGRGDFELGGFIHRLRIWHEAQSPRNFVYQLGIFGESTESLIARLPMEAGVRRPHLLILYPGFNDIRREGAESSENAVSIEEFRNSMAALVECSLKISPTLMLTGFPFEEAKTTPYLGSDWYYLRADAARYTDVLRQVCEERSCPILDYFKNWDSEKLSNLLADDGLHCNPTGHEKLYRELREFLENKFQADKSGSEKR